MMFREVNIVLQDLVSGLILDHLQVIYYMGLADVPIKSCCKSIRLVKRVVETLRAMCLLLKILFSASIGITWEIYKNLHSTFD